MTPVYCENLCTYNVTYTLCIRKVYKEVYLKT